MDCSVEAKKVLRMDSLADRPQRWLVSGKNAGKRES